jgi:ABC-2 type transport system ATP-binding protein
MVGLSQTLTRPVGEFSKGMQRRIGLAQALINDPDLVILDEPTSGLDPIGCREVKDLIIALARRGKTVILSSHLLADVEDVCDRVVIYYGGKVQAIGTLKELLATPDAIRITTPVLSRATMERVLEVIRKDVAMDKVRIDNPTQNLESYFLDVVQKARQAAAETSGAVSGARIAEYLRGDGAGEAGSEKLLERLTLPQPAQTPAPALSAPAPAVDEEKLEELTKASGPGPDSAGSVPVSQEAAKDLSKADEKLSSLLGGGRPESGA